MKTLGVEEGGMGEYTLEILFGAIVENLVEWSPLQQNQISVALLTTRLYNFSIPPVYFFFLNPTIPEPATGKIPTQGS